MFCIFEQRHPVHFLKKIYTAEFRILSNCDWQCITNFDVYVFTVQSVQVLSRVRLFATPWTAARQASLSMTNFLELAQTQVQPVGDVIQPSHPLSPLLLLPSIFPSIRVFSKESVLCIRWPKYWSFSFSIGPSSEYSWLISFRIDWFNLLAVQGTLKSLQHYSSKAPIFQHSAFFIVQLSHSYMTIGKTIALTSWKFD